MKLFFKKETPNYKNRSAGKPMLSMKTRIMSKVDVDRNGCWIWKGSYRKSGYGKMNVGSKASGTRHTATASRVSYETFVGPIPDGMVICHKCDNPKCVNPNHLFVGTFKDNYDDMVAKGRRNNARGSRIATSKLTDAKVRKIKKSRRSTQELADQFGVSASTVRRILNGTTWKHV